MSKMFPFISKTWNPIGGECSHRCVGCWASALAERHKWSKYQGKPRVDEKQINRRFKKGDFVFVQDMTDLFAEDVPREVILRVMEQIAKSPEALFLLLTKNSKRYFDFLCELPDNCVLGVTIESDLINPLNGNAPHRQERMFWMLLTRFIIDLKWEQDGLAAKGYKKPHIFVSIEPILDFNLDEFAYFLIHWLKPGAVAVGYDNYGNGFPEPPLAKTMQLIDRLESMGVKVYRKTLREAQN